MDFTEVVELAKRLHVDGYKLSDDDVVSDKQTVSGRVYGRICSTESRDSPPSRLSDTRGRKTAFVFGSDAISSVILRLESYQAIRSLGFTREYIRHKLVEKNRSYWLILFKLSKEQEDFISPATWDGVTHVVDFLYPKASPDLRKHLSILKETPVIDFEKKAGFQFLENKKNQWGLFPDKPPYYSYEFYCTLPQPRTALQVRLFLYCELRLLEMFRGDGFASTQEPGSIRCMEYISHNIYLCDIDQDFLAVLPMNHITIPY